MSIKGVRVWLSGSVPKEASEEQSNQINEFVRTFATEIFRQGGVVIHGCHPSLVPVLLDSAKNYQEASKRKAPLELVASAKFGEDGEFGEVSKDELEKYSSLDLTPAHSDEETSLQILRDTLATRSDVLVALGGKWWQIDQLRAGVPKEFLLATNRGIPSFILGNFGGSTQSYLDRHPEILRNLRNGLDEDANISLSKEGNLEKLVNKVIKQIGLLPLGRRETSEGQPYRILALDGGGVKGAFTAGVLARWEEKTGLSTATQFDLIAGTSTGGILALGLALGIEAKVITEFYEKSGSEIFPMTNFMQQRFRNFLHFVNNKFDPSKLETVLQKVYGKDTTLAKCKTRVLITSYNLTSDNLVLYRTSHHPNVSGNDNLKVVRVARATSAAPTYFKASPVEDSIAKYEAVDGGVWANSPVMAALCEAVNILKWPLDRIEILSVGTTNAPSLVGQPYLLTGLLGWAKRAPDLFMKTQMQSTLKYAKDLLNNRFLRVDDIAETNGLDDVNSIPLLINKGVEKADSDCYSQVQSRFFNGVPVKNWREL